LPPPANSSFAAEAPELLAGEFDVALLSTAEVLAGAGVELDAPLVPAELPLEQATDTIRANRKRPTRTILRDADVIDMEGKRGRITCVRKSPTTKLRR
jgi:hypothetical protein